MQSLVFVGEFEAKGGSGCGAETASPLRHHLGLYSEEVGPSDAVSAQVSPEPLFSPKAPASNGAPTNAFDFSPEMRTYSVWTLTLTDMTQMSSVLDVQHATPNKTLGTRYRLSSFSLQRTHHSSQSCRSDETQVVVCCSSAGFLAVLRQRGQPADDAIARRQVCCSSELRWWSGQGSW